MEAICLAIMGPSWKMGVLESAGPKTEEKSLLGK